MLFYSFTAPDLPNITFFYFIIFTDNCTVSGNPGSHYFLTLIRSYGSQNKNLKKIVFYIALPDNLKNTWNTDG